MKAPTEEALELLADVIDADDEEDRVQVVAEFIASLTPNGPVPSFLNKAVDKAEANVYAAGYKWLRRLVKRDPKKRAARRARRRAKRNARR